MHIFHPVVLNI